jgi:hypothetical protein
MFEMRNDTEKYFNAFHKHFHIFDLAAGMDMQIADAEIVFAHYIQYLTDLFNRNTEFAFIVAGGNFEIAACHDIGTKTETYRISIAELLTEFFEVLMITPRLTASSISEKAMPLDV